MKEITRVKLNHYLRDNHLSRAQLAREIDYDETMLNRVCNYDAPISKDLRDKLVRYFENLAEFQFNLSRDDLADVIDAMEKYSENHNLTELFREALDK